MVRELEAEAGNPPAVSVIVATHDRVSSLRLLLDGLSRLNGREAIPFEVIVANNAGNDATAELVAKTAREYSASGVAVRVVREPLPGKCRAQNAAIREARGSILAFLDDDVKVTPQWLRAVHDFFKKGAFEVMQGAILMPPEIRNDQEFLRAYHRYRTIPFVQYNPGRREITTLTGANMGMRRELFSRVGLFDERLGPGRSGISEDVEFAQRIIRLGGRIGYEPKAAVYHEVDWSRLTEAFFRLRHEQQGRSRLIYKRNSPFSIIANLMRSIWGFGWYSLVGNERRKYRAKGRYFHYMAMLSEKFKTFNPFNAL
jgi:GT2 family glycosyltransferase